MMAHIYDDSELAVSYSKLLSLLIAMDMACPYVNFYYPVDCLAILLAAD